MRSPTSTWMLACGLTVAAGGRLMSQDGAGAASKAVLEQLVAAVNRHDLDAATGTYAQSFRWGPLSDTAGLMPSTAAQLRAYLAGYWTQNPKSRLETVEVLAVGPFVVAHQRLSGDAGGKSHEILDILDVRAGHIVADWESADVAALPPSVAREASAVVQGAEDAWSARDPDAAAPYLLADIPVRTLGDTTMHRETLKTMRDGFHDAVARNPHLRYSVIDRMVVGPFYVAHERLTGMADAVTRDKVDAFQVKDGHVVAEWESAWLESGRPTP